jgi:MgtE intracellular N domain/CBS domain
MADVLHFSMVARSDLLDSAGERLGRVEDLIIRLADAGYPPITGVRATVAGRDVFVPAETIAQIEPGRVRLARERLDLRRFERREGEILLGKDVLDRQLINVDGARLVRANDVELARLEGWWRVVGVNVSMRGALRRLLPRGLALRVPPDEFLDWAGVEPFVGHVPTVRLRVPHPKLARLRPAEIADLVEAASHREGREIIQAVAADPEREADVFEELDPAHQLEFIAERSNAEAVEVLVCMGPDDAADLLADLDEHRREALLALLPEGTRRKVRMLLGFDSATAGGLMSTDFLCMYETATVAEALDRVRGTTAPPEALTDVYAMTPTRRLSGVVKLPELLRAEPDDGLRQLVDPDPVRLVPDADFEEVARVMADFNLTTVPVCDQDGRMIGLVTVDDVLEVMLPAGWRRRFGLLGGD